MKNNSPATPFCLEGKFLGLVWKGQKLKYLRMIMGEDELEIALSKSVRSWLSIQNNIAELSPWDSIQVFVKEKQGTGKRQRKVYDLRRCVDNYCESLLLAKESQITPQAKLLVCQKSGCQKKAPSKQHQAIENILRDRQLHKLVTIEETGCLGKCSMAPNIVLMPGKRRLSGMPPQAIADLLETLPSN